MKRWLAMTPIACCLVLADEAFCEIVDDVEIAFPAHFNFDDPEVGSVQVKVIDVGEPAKMPLRMTLIAKCLDHRKTPTAVKPRWDMIIDAEMICYFGPYSQMNGKVQMWNEKEKLLTLHFSQSPFGSGQSKCSKHYDQVFDMWEHCADWRK
ncbi:hypothetical protein [Bradyrhizobium sp. 162]|uniref:hypothetical protein n=1 Tax=Bradyrhizobium sp. 162 TaxID=2782635 RepID=UPI001FFABAE5|nr:hypothetical protein [Bradyrhizobium sp. 162]MCK1632643.1 hypothetical protein [Bradyrhizobium sp. 162]